MHLLFHVFLVCVFLRASFGVDWQRQEGLVASQARVQRSLDVRQELENPLEHLKEKLAERGTTIGTEIRHAFTKAAPAQPNGQHFVNGKQFAEVKLCL